VIRARSGKTAAGRLLLGAGVLALLIPAIAGCEAGAHAPTLEFHPAAAGAQTVFNGIQISNAFVLGAPSGSTVPSGSSASMFVSLYNGGASSDTLMSASAAGAATSVTLSGGTVTLPSNAAVNLTGPEPKVVLEKLTVPLTGGGTVPVTFDFEHAGTVTMQVPVEAQSYYYSTYSPPAATPSAAVSAAASPTVTPTGAGGSGQPTSTASATTAP
jgi:copper(I)-binding protein